MWLITEDGFFNIVCDDEDRKNSTLTLKARRREDLHSACYGTGADILNVESSDKTDYKYRIRIPVDSVARYIAAVVKNINYPKTKPRMAGIDPTREGIYFQVWDALTELQE